MKDCSNHKKEVAGISDMKDLANRIGDLHYETLADLLDNLQNKIWNDGQRDISNGRTKLGNNLVDASFSLSNTAYFIKEAWDISKQFMDKNKINNHD